MQTRENKSQINRAAFSASAIVVVVVRRKMLKISSLIILILSLSFISSLTGLKSGLYAQQSPGSTPELEEIYIEQYTKEFLGEYVSATDSIIASYMSSSISLAGGLASEGLLNIGWFVPKVNISMYGGTKFVFPITSKANTVNLLNKTIRNDALHSSAPKSVRSAFDTNSKIILNSPSFIAFVGVKMNFEVERFNLNRMVFNFVYGLPLSSINYLEQLRKAIDYPGEDFSISTEVFSFAFNYKFFESRNVIFATGASFTYTKTLAKESVTVSDDTYTVESANGSTGLENTIFDLEYTIKSSYSSKSYFSAAFLKAEFPFPWIKPYLEFRLNILLSSAQDGTHSVSYTLDGVSNNRAINQTSEFTTRTKGKKIDPVIPSLMVGFNLLYGLNLSFEISLFRGKIFSDAFSLNLFFNFDL